MLNEEDYNMVHALAERLTGDSWCPYPSNLFCKVIQLVDDYTAKLLIDKRREFSFPHFFVGEPQYNELVSHLTK